MIRECCWCDPRHDLGEVEPFDRKDITSGMCAAAAAREKVKIDNLLTTPQAKAIRLSFFAADVAEKRQIHDGEVTPRSSEKQGGRNP